MENWLGLNMQSASRQEVESSRTDFNRFEHPGDYTSESDLQYFRTDFNRNMFRDYYLYNGLFSNETMLALASLSTSAVNIKWSVGKPVNMMYELHRKECFHAASETYDLEENVFCSLYHSTLNKMESHFNSGLVNLEETNLQEYFLQLQKTMLENNNLR